MDLEIARRLRGGLPLYTVLAAILLVLAIGLLLNLARDILIPVALAAVLSFVLAPAVRAMQRVGVPQGAAVAITVLLAFGGIAGLFYVVGSQLAGIGSELPRYQSTIRTKIAALGEAATPGGSASRAFKALEGIGQDVRHMVAGSTGKSGDSPAPTPVVVTDETGVLGTVGGVVSPLLHPLATVFVVLIFTIFVLSSREDLRNRFVRLLGTDDIQHTTAAIDDAGRRLSKFFLMQLAINAGFGVIVSLGLWAIGIPSPFLWGIIAGVLRFIPYVGAFIGAMPPLLLAIAVDPGWSMLLWTAALFAFSEPLIGHGVEPLLFGHSTGLSPVAVILSATVWTFLWGPIGLVLATPLTVCLVVLGRHVASLSFLDVLLGDRPALSPPEIFYQRMLAGDPSEAAMQARDFLKERALATYYDEVALEALRLAHEDVARGRLTPARQAVLLRSTGQLVEQVGRFVKDPRPHGRTMGSEAAAAVHAAGPDRSETAEVLAPNRLPETWRGAVPVICEARPDTLDAVIAAMLVQVLNRHGLKAEFREMPRNLASSGGTAAETRVVCLSYLEPLSTLHLRYAVRLARARHVSSKVMVGIWRERDSVVSRALRKASRADDVVPTIGAALAFVLAAARANEPPRGVAPVAFRQAA